MTKKQTEKWVDFKIDHIDPLGQGVSKIDDKITFIPKTLPGEEGKAEVIKEKKSIQFARVENISEKSEKRISPECEHYEQCPSCDFLHTDYDHEVELKFKSFQFELKKLDFLESAQILKGAERFHYRNRIQLHYDLKKSLLGYMKGNSILPVPHCLLAEEKIHQEVQKLYSDVLIKEPRLFPQSPQRGHVELYLDPKTNQVLTAFNKPYAHLGFTQVNQPVNNMAVKKISDQINAFNPELVLDLFGGQGNLSQKTQAPTVIVDRYRELPQTSREQQFFCNLDLFKQDSPDKLLQFLVKNTELNVDKMSKLLIVDPPRSGCKNLEDYSKVFQPQYLIYMSCKVSTMARDLESIKDQYQFLEASMIDFFPGTHHYEGLVFAERK